MPSPSQSAFRSLRIFRTYIDAMREGELMAVYYIARTAGPAEMME
jgi:hypothetical protein